MGAARPAVRWPELFRNWALRRQGPDRLPRRLEARRIYIVPTAAGWTLALAVAVMFVAGINYGNGLALLFAFWLAGFGLVAMIRTQRNLAGMLLSDAFAAPVFAGQQVELRLAAEGRADLDDLALDTGSRAAARDSGEAREDGHLRVPVPAPRRGRWQAPPLRISSTAPFGLFRTWTWLALDTTTLVYPRPAGVLPVPETPGREAGRTEIAHGEDELAWLREFREGDSPRQVAWKAYARGAPLLVREYRGAGAGAQREFDFDRLAPLTVEARLSQLTRWILDAAARGEQWTLRLPGSPALSGAGAEHRDACLARLALYGPPGQKQ